MFEKNENTRKVDAAITDIRYETNTGVKTGKKQHYVYVTYSYNGREYENVETSLYQNGMQVGDIISVEIDSESGNVVTSQRTFNFMGALVAFFGILFGIGGFFMVKE